jgi:hypothetical protein
MEARFSENEDYTKYSRAGILVRLREMLWFRTARTDD